MKDWEAFFRSGLFRQMSLTRIDVRHVRNIDAATLEPSPQLNFLIGANGSGKTSLIEAIYILGRGRSFRSNQARQVINFSCDSLTVSGKAQQEGRPSPIGIGVQLSRQKREMFLEGQKLQSCAELIWAFPVSLIHPGCSGLLEEAPRLRRQFLDWGTFHMERSYLEVWRGYARALRQRNSLLRSGAFQYLDTWNHEVGRYGTMVTEARDRYARRLLPYFLHAARHFLGTEELAVRTAPGWESDRAFEEVLVRDFAIDRKYGATQAGPHRGDFSILIEGKPAKSFLSRGQIKMLVFALFLAQGHLLEESAGKRGCMLIDDLASELDTPNRAKLLRFLAARKGQFVITATDDWVREDMGCNDATVFHVEQGGLSRA
jgi:DNA replication and repair protein RecF